VSFRVRLTREAEADLERLFDFVLDRELDRAGGDLQLAELALAAIRAGVSTLRSSPFTCRKAGPSPFLRESDEEKDKKSESHDRSPKNIVRRGAGKASSTGLYSCRSASIGSSRAARRAG